MTGAEPAAQPRLPFSRPQISEAAIAEVVATLRSGWIASGPKVVEFEKAFAAFVEAPHAVAFVSGTAGLDAAMALLELTPGDEVITPSLNWVSGPNMVELHGGTTVFADVDPRTLQIDVAHVRSLLSPRTRAVMPVHFAGAPCDLAGLRAILPPGVTLIEDAAHAIGTRCAGAPIGEGSSLAVYSFHPTKNLTTGEGGMVVTDRADWADRLRVLRFHGIRKDAWKAHGRSGRDEYAVVEPARKYNLTDIAAALGIHQLRELPAMNARRAELAALYRRGLASSTIARPLDEPARPGDTHCWHIYVVALALERMRVDRAGVVDRLEARGIGTALHFPAVHLQHYYRERYPRVALPVTEGVHRRILSLPLFPGMADADVARVCAALSDIEREVLT